MTEFTFPSVPVDSQGINFGRWLRKVLQEPGSKTDGLCEPFPDGDTLRDTWNRGEVEFHVNIGIRAQLPDVDACYFCAYLYRCSALSGGDSRNRAILRVAPLDDGSRGQNPEWLDRTVLVEAREVRERRQTVQGDLAFTLGIRLVAANHCDVCGRTPGSFLGMTSLKSLLVNSMGK